jgi:hypothetical protein
MMIRKNAVSIPAVPAPSKRTTALIAVITPRIASCLEPISPVANSTSVMMMISGISAMNTP